jgi:hypothetical protein
VSFERTFASTTCVSAKMSPIRTPRRSVKIMYASNPTMGSPARTSSGQRSGTAQNTATSAKGALRSSDSW